MNSIPMMQMDSAPDTLAIDFMKIPVWAHPWYAIRTDKFFRGVALLNGQGACQSAAITQMIGKWQ